MLGGSQTQNEREDHPNVTLKSFKVASSRGISKIEEGKYDERPEVPYAPLINDEELDIIIAEIEKENE